MANEKKDLVIVIGMDDTAECEKAVPEVSWVGIPIEEEQWNDVLSPWPAEAVFKSQPGFGGYAGVLAEQISEYLFELKQIYHPKRIFLCGYSLAGLFCLYAGTRMKFDGVASVSGSLWFPKFTEWLKDHPLKAQKIYFSLGEKEKDSRNPVLATVEEKTLEASEIVSAYADTVFEKNEGGHFVKESPRIIRAVRWLIAE